MQIDNWIKLKNEFGDAFYVLDSEKFKNNFFELKKAFSDIYPKFNIAYSYKTNYTPKLCKIINQLGGYAEVVSEMEAELAKRIGVVPSNIIWNGPVKNPEALKVFLLSGGLANIDSFDDFTIIKKIIDKYPDYIFKLGIRVNFDVGDGVLSRFGVDVNSNEFAKILDYMLVTPNVKLVDLQCHFAKRQLEYWSTRTKKMIDLIEQIGLIPDRVDLGGGLFGKMEESLKKQFSSKIPTYKEYAEVVAGAFKAKFLNNGPKLIIEPGSALVGDCMKFVGTVKTIKNVQNKWFATVLGSQKNISMYSVNPPMEIIHTGTEVKTYNNIDIVGYTCIESDVLFRNYSGKLGLGDTVVFSNCGSYSLVMKPPFILPNFPVIDLNRGEPEVVKSAERFDDIFRTFQY